MIVYVNGEPRQVADTVRLSELVDAGRGVAVAVDGVVVPRDRHPATSLTEGARIEIVTAVQGG